MDYTPTSRRLSDISHLFLSDVRSNQTGQQPRPARTPPGAFKGDVSVDLSPEEFADMMRPAAASDPTFKPLRAVVAHHLGETLCDRVRDLAVTLAGGEPVGVIYADSGAVRVGFVDPANVDATAEEAVTEPLSVQRLREVLVELDQDVSQWLLVLPDHKNADTRSLLARVGHWTLLSAADHDGVVAAYRALKGVFAENTPQLTVHVFDADASADAANQSARKLTGVCEQFLKTRPCVGPTVTASPHVREICLLDAASDAGDDAHWQVLAALADGAAVPASLDMSPPAAAEVTAPVPADVDAAGAAGSRPVSFDRPTRVESPCHGTAVAAPMIVPVMRSIPVPVMTPPAPATPAAPLATPATSAADDAQTVLELPNNDASPAGVLAAVIRGGGDWLESPVKAPNLPDAVVAVSRDRRLTLLAVAKPGLGDLQSVAAGLKWMSENRALIAMAVPQLAIDAFAEPRLHVLVDHADATADALRPLLAAGSVTVAAYRRVKFAGRAGVLLDAA